MSQSPPGDGESRETLWRLCALCTYAFPLFRLGNGGHRIFEGKHHRAKRLFILGRPIWVARPAPTAEPPVLTTSFAGGSLRSTPATHPKFKNRLALTNTARFLTPPYWRAKNKFEVWLIDASGAIHRHSSLNGESTFIINGKIMPLQKSIFLLLLIGFVFVGLSGCGPSTPPKPISRNDPSTDNAEVDSEEPIEEEPVDAPSSESAQEVALKDVLAAVKADPEAAAEKYHGKHLQLTGYLHGMDPDAMVFEYPPQITVTTDVMKPYDIEATKKWVVCTTAGKLPWEVCRVGDQVTVSGRAKIAYGRIVLEETVITTDDGSPAETHTVEEFAKLVEADVPAAVEKYKYQWVTLTGKVVENIREAGSNHKVVVYKSDKIIIQAEYSDVGKHPLNEVQPGDEITIGDTLRTIENEGVETFHFSGPWVKQN